MSILRRAIPVALTLGMLMGVLPGAASASDYPNSTIRVVVANTPGSSVDTVARHLSDHVSKQFGQPTFIDNKPGAGGLIGSQHLVRSAPDGYSVGIMSSSYTIVPYLNENINFDPINDIEPIALVGSLPLVLVTSPASRFDSAQTLIDEAKTSPNTITYGSPGVGTALHLGGVQLQSLTSTQFLHVPYKGVGPLLVDAMAGTLDVSMLTVGSAVKLIEDGKLKPLAVSSKTDLLPEVPTLAEAGASGFDFEAWVMVIAPKGTPSDIVNAWSEKVKVAVTDPKFEEVLIANGMTPLYKDPTGLKDYLERDYAKIGELVKTFSDYAK